MSKTYLYQVTRSIFIIDSHIYALPQDSNSTLKHVVDMSLWSHTTNQLPLSLDRLWALPSTLFQCDFLHVWHSPPNWLLGIHFCCMYAIRKLNILEIWIRTRNLSKLWKTKITKLLLLWVNIYTTVWLNVMGPIQMHPQILIVENVEWKIQPNLHLLYEHLMVLGKCINKWDKYVVRIRSSKGWGRCDIVY